MTFTVETGEGLYNANAYVTVAAFKTYHKDRSNSIGTAGSSQIQDAIVKATDYMDRRFRDRFIGVRKERDRSTNAVTPAQRLEWPRCGAYDNSGALINADTVPIEIEEACFEYGIRALSAELAPDPEVSDSNSLITRTFQKVGPIEDEVEYSENTVPFKFRDYPETDAILSGLLKPTGMAVR